VGGAYAAVVPVELEVRDAAPAFGAVVTGIDLREPVADGMRQELVRLLRERFLLVFPRQGLDADQHVGAAAHFGPIAQEGLTTKHQVGYVSNHRPDGVLGSTAASFHIDYGFNESPYEALSLYGLEIPPAGTQTWFVSGVAAARDLPTDLRARVAGLEARHAVDVHSPVGEAGVRVREGRLDDTYPHARRPVLWRHHATGDEILAVWEQHTDALLPMDPDASTVLIEELFAHLYRPEHRYVHEWHEGDLVVWDNHAVQHGRPEVGSAPRTLRRVCIGRDQDLSLFVERAAARAMR
jgi:alpha-ketoglutarate-dependent taurine dioxygenase